MKHLQKIVISVVLTGVIIVVSMLSLSIYRAKTNLQNHKNRFLLDADHQALLESCRTILQNSESQTYLEEANWPDIIKNLKPSAVMIDPNQRCMDIMAGGGFYMFGVIALQKESSFAPNASPGGFQYTKLIDGLWYYEE